jgi:hypothetical protein
MTGRTDADVAAIVDLIDDDVAQWQSIVGVLHRALLEDLARLHPARTMPRLKDLNGAEAAAFRCIAESSARVYGAGFIATPEAFVDAPGLVWVTKSVHGGASARLVVDAEFYGYTTAPWWIGTLNDDEFHTTGPYVDASGTNEYITTYSRRVTLDEVLVGVIGVDVLVSQLQRHLQAAICRLPAESCITDVDGAVLVTNTGRLLGATLDPIAISGPRHRIASTGWYVVIGVPAVT